MDDGSREHNVCVDRRDARRVRGTLRLSEEAAEFRAGLTSALELLPSLRSVDSGDTWARLVTRSRSALGSVVVRIDLRHDSHGAWLEVALAPSVRFALGASTARVQALGRELLETLDRAFAPER